jgi:hypothetical protein
MKGLLPTVLTGLVLAGGCMVNPPVPSATFDAADGSHVTVYTVQRVPKALGGEEYVFLELARGGQRSARLEVDINGRFGASLHVDTSADSEWARAYVDLYPPWVGEVVPINAGEGGYLFKSHSLGETVKKITFPYSVIAYVHFPSGFVLNHVNGSVEERGSILGLVAELPSAQVINSKRVEWRPTRRR